MRTGAEYRRALRDGRRVWVMGEGLIDDVTTHPATRAMVDEYVAWYDLLRDPAGRDPTWRDIVLRPQDGAPWAYAVPRSADDLGGMGRFFAATTFLSAGNITHTPCYGHMIALGILASAQESAVSAEQIASAGRYREMIAETGRFLTFCGGAPTIGYRLREDPVERAALRIVRETDAGIVVSGKIGMHTSPAYAEDVYVGSVSGLKLGEHFATFVVPVAAPGVTILCRKIAVREANPFMAPLSSRFDELDGQIWLDDVFIPWEQVFLLGQSPEPVVRWLIWHHVHGWLSKAEFTLGLALALAHAMSLARHEQTIEYLIDLATDVQMVRSCLVACERDPHFTASGYCVPNHAHLAAGGLAILRARPRMDEILRIVPGSSLVVAPSDRDLAAPEVAEGLAQAFGGGGYSALQRAALLQMAWDHVSSALDGRESAFELHASGGTPAWRGRLRRNFDGYSDLANRVAGLLSVAMPRIDLEHLREVPWSPRRQVAIPVAGGNG
ncbi:MAG TPA: 4-hydroxyphenylacetate 3-hydroxylase N-terminal domain-containing protein [Stellaceae bacterium]|nr:4-hydroxyphenylacetate 3-hydroxylase N-terminal domain-containing protein [Stellaceae bacterium]